MGQLSATAVRDIVVDRLADGAYPIGSQLPTARAFANELGANRNTVAKAYQQLATMGLVTVQQGRGTFVVSLLEAGASRPLVAQLEERLADQIQQARRLGLAETTLRAMVDAQIATTYTTARHGLYVECNTGDLETGIGEIEAHSGVRLTPLLLSNLNDQPQRTTLGYDVVVTSLPHFKEVTETLAAADVGADTIGVYTQPDEAALNVIARLRSESAVGVVVASSGGAIRFINHINTVAMVSTTPLVMPTNHAILELSRQVDVIVCSHSRAQQVAALRLLIPVIELQFHISRQSLSRVADALLPGTRTSSL